MLANLKEGIYGKEHDMVANLYVSIGDAYYQMNDYSKALNYLSQALAIREKVLGSEAPKTIQTKERISEIQDKLKE